jgi:hypothetical protein
MSRIPETTSQRQPTEQQRIEVWRNDTLTAAARRDALEEAARICEARAMRLRSVGTLVGNDKAAGMDSCAFYIRKARARGPAFAEKECNHANAS